MGSAGDVSVNVFDEEGNSLLGLPAADLADLWEQKNQGDIDAGCLLAVVFQRLNFRRFTAKILSSWQEHEGSGQMKMVLDKSSCIDFVSEADTMLTAIHQTFCAGSFESA